MDGWMEDGEMTNQSKSTMVISASVVYFYITSVHPRGNLTSREWSVSPFPSLRGWGFISKAMMNSQQTPTPYGPWVSMHLNEPSLPLPRTTQGFLNSLSLLSSTTSNTITTAILALLHPHPLPFLPLSLSHFLLWHFFFLVHITKDSFHLLFMMDSSTFFKAPYVISKFVAALNQTTKRCKPSFLTTLSLVSFSALLVLNQKVRGSILVIRASKLPVSPQAGASLSGWITALWDLLPPWPLLFKAQHVSHLYNYHENIPLSPGLPFQVLRLKGHCPKFKEGLPLSWENVEMSARFHCTLAELAK